MVTAGDDQPARWFLVVFGGSLFAQAVFLNLESGGRSLRWFTLGALSAVLASGYAALVRGKLAFVHVAAGSKPYNELTPAFDTLGGCLLIAGGLAVISGIVVAVIHLLVTRRGHLAVMSLILLATWLLFWRAAVAAHTIR